MRSYGALLCASSLPDGACNDPLDNDPPLCSVTQESNGLTKEQNVPNDMTLAALNIPDQVRVARQAADHRKSGTARPMPDEVAPSLGADTLRKSGTARSLANEVAPSRGADARRIEPMLLVYQEQAETFRLIVVALRRAFGAIARWFAG
jgi:hypothetical protein